MASDLGYKIESSPSSNPISIGQNSLQYTLNVQNNSTLTQILNEFEITNPVINADNYMELKDLYNQMIKDQSEYFVISKQD